MIERRQYEKLARLLPEFYSAQTLETFPKHVVDLLPRLIPECTYGYNETNFARRRFEVLADPSYSQIASEAAANLARLMNQHPMVLHNRSTDQRALKMSDLISQRQFRRLEIYDVVYRWVPAEYLMTGGFRVSPAGDIVTLAFGREATDFGEDERDLLNLLRPHLEQAYRNADAMTTFQSQLECREESLQQAVSMAVVAVEGGKIKHASRLAIRWLSSFFSDGIAPNDELPDRLRRWVRFWQTSLDGKQSELKTCTPLTVESADARLNIRLLKTSRDGEVILLLSHEVTPDRPELLQRLGLAPREAEVLFWISKGKTSREVAAILSITRKTVDKHVERIHRKLGTETRTAAASIAWSAMRDS
ncbi:MAG: helix-turn-helix transcriptional regulator [Candidatus Binatus sp.]|jgi:DNA-binding CsgD family transcriptional regulator